MASTNEEHFVATIQVKKISRVVSDSGRGFDTVASPRQKSSIASISISASDLEILRQKISAHINLIDDGGDIVGD